MNINNEGPNDDDSLEFKTKALSVFNGCLGIIQATLSTTEKKELSAQEASVLQDSVKNALDQIKPPLKRVRTIDSSESFDPNIPDPHSTSDVSLPQEDLRGKLAKQIQNLLANLLINNFKKVAERHKTELESLVRDIRIFNEKSSDLLDAYQIDVLSKIYRKETARVIVKQQHESMAAESQQLLTHTTELSAHHQLHEPDEQKLFAEVITNLRDYELYIMSSMEYSFESAHFLDGISNNKKSELSTDPLLLPSTERFLNYIQRMQHHELANLAHNLSGVWRALMLSDSDLPKMQKLVENEHKRIQTEAIENARKKPHLLREEGQQMRSPLDARLFEFEYNRNNAPGIPIPAIPAIQPAGGPKAIQDSEYPIELSDDDLRAIREEARTQTPEVEMWPDGPEPIHEGGIFRVTDNNKWVLVRIDDTVKSLDAKSLANLHKPATTVDKSGPNKSNSEDDFLSSAWVTAVEISRIRIPGVNPDLNSDAIRAKLAKLKSGEIMGRHEVVADNSKQIDNDILGQHNPLTLQVRPPASNPVAPSRGRKHQREISDVGHSYEDLLNRKFGKDGWEKLEMPQHINTGSLAFATDPPGCAKAEALVSACFVTYEGSTKNGIPVKARVVIKKAEDMTNQEKQAIVTNKPVPFPDRSSNRGPKR
ncbi:MAG TPA: hypothetical protein VM532_09595 [Burkholderiales bacterium]|nr:hypothetical protein [Burkholderiales bacterium]